MKIIAAPLGVVVLATAVVAGDGIRLNPWGLVLAVVVLAAAGIATAWDN
jgi:hypothetical protein